jgi:hypothetical protein
MSTEDSSNENSSNEKAATGHLRAKTTPINEERLRLAAREALYLKGSLDLPSIVKGFGEALAALQVDAMLRGLDYSSDKGTRQRFMTGHPLCVIYGERIATLTRTGGLTNVSTTSLGDKWSDSIQALESMAEGERIMWYAPGVKDIGED